MTDSDYEVQGGKTQRFLAGVLGGGIVLVVSAVLGFPDLFQVCWGLATAVYVWRRFEPVIPEEVLDGGG